MADTRKLKKTRGLKLSNFNKSYNALKDGLLEGDATMEGVMDAFEGMKTAFNQLREAHESYYVEVEDAVITAEGVHAHT